MAAACSNCRPTLTNVSAVLPENNIPPPPCITHQALCPLAYLRKQNIQCCRSWLISSSTSLISYIIWPEEIVKSYKSACPKIVPKISKIWQIASSAWRWMESGQTRRWVIWWGGCAAVAATCNRIQFVAVQRTIFSNKYFPLIWVCPEHRHCTDTMLFPGYLLTLTIQLTIY